VGVRITHNPDRIRQGFRSLHTRRDVASLLDVELKILVYNVLKLSEARRYRGFDIPKKSGGQRRILAPNDTLVVVQRKLADVLNVVYAPKPPAHGFVVQRCVVTNARPHIRRRFVFNIDLQDFFPSINFGRVRGMFMAPPYRLNSEVATLLAQICSFRNTLPQGAPTSPVVSNMICARMDGELQRLANRHRCRYSRYCDDITFSSNDSDFPGAIASMSGGQVEAGPELRQVVASNGFMINDRKTRLHGPRSRRTVTGLVTNKKVNVRRTFVRQIRAMLHAWRKFGLDAAATTFVGLDKKHRAKPNPSFKRVVKGKIDFLGMVRGKADAVYLRFLKQYAALDPEFRMKADPEAVLERALWVLDSEELQGTGFMLEGYGLITSAHVLRPDTQAFRRDKPLEKFPVRVLYEHPAIDLAVCATDAPKGTELSVGSSDDLVLHDSVRVVGFPNYRLFDTMMSSLTTINQMRMASTVRQFTLNCPLNSGCSGGPVLNSDNKVVGIVATGTDNPTKAFNTTDHAAIRVEELQRLLPVPEAPAEGAGSG
jgi:RNA-directed DNA polymerase